MANVNSISSNSYSSTSSIYGTRNVLSGLASGLDTESMIENSVSGYKAKINELQQQQDKLTWKQDAYRDITDKLINLTRNYTSYTSKTNLYSESFFAQATTTPSGENASLVSATGKSSSNVQINAVKSLATSAKYTVSADALGLTANNSGSAIDWSGLSLDSNSTVTVSVDGVTKSYSLTGKDGLNLSNSSTTEDLVKALQDKADADFGKGKVTFEATEADGTGGLKFSVVGNSAVRISSNVSGLGLGTSGLTSSVDTGTSLKNLLSGYFTADNAMEGAEIDASKGTLKVDDTLELSYDKNGNLVRQMEITNEDGTTSTKNVRVTNNGSMLYDFQVNGKSVGTFTESDSLESVINGINRSDSGITASFSKLTGEFQFTSRETGAASRIDFGGLGSALFDSKNSPDKVMLQDLDAFSGIVWNADGTAKFGVGATDEMLTVKKDQTLQDMIDSLDKLRERDTNIPKISFDSRKGTFTLTGGTSGNDVLWQDDPGQNSVSVSFADVFASRGPGGVYEAGADAELDVTVNGKDMTLTRSSNTVDLDGMTVSLKGEFNVTTDADGKKVVTGEPITFSSSTSSDSILEGIRSFVDEYNSVAKAIHDAYSTQPAEKNSSTHTKYDPLTEDDKADMSESAISKYEEKAKQGILFGDSDLSMLYSKLTNLVSTGNIAQELREIGITTEYSGGLTTLSIDEEKLKTALDGNPEKVSSIFTRTANAETGATDGLMARMKSTLDNYASTSSASPGVLVRKAGTTLASTSLLKNDVQTQINNMQEKIESWQTKMSTKIDYYTRQFTALEKLMNTMNSQSSALAGLMGY